MKIKDTLKKWTIPSDSLALRLLFALFLSSAPLSCLFAQDVVSIDYLLGTEPQQLEVYAVDKSDTETVYIPFDFSSSKYENEDLFNSLLTAKLPIERIDFVYTRYKTSEDFDQEKLNRSRLELLRKHAPFIFDDNLIEWNFYEQTNNLGLEGNKKLFHGFVIHYLHHPTYAGNTGGLTTEEEIEAIEAYLKELKLSLTGRAMLGISESPRRYTPILKSKQKKGIQYTKKLFGRWRKPIPTRSDTTWIETYVGGYYAPFCDDSVVMRTLRKYEDKWNCNYLVEDVTGSMYPYIAQTLAWKKLKMENSILEHFVFFNDGDHRPDGPIGKSGGAYYIQSHDFEQIGTKITEVMHKGGGGGIPENNIEATLFAASTFTESDSYILVADNNAAIRDMSLANKITKPTHIILCGVRGGRMHHSYIKLALQTGGSLHTIEEDVDDVKELKPGTVFDMGGQKWQFLSNGSIVLVR